MPIVAEIDCTVQFYRDHFDQIDIPRPRTCPHCGAVDSFIGHGYYWRQPLARWEDYLIRIRRWLCKTCRHTVSILPSFLLRYRHYLLAVIQDVVTAHFERDVSWAQIEQQGRRGPGDECMPSERTIRRWCASFDEHAPRWLAAVQQTLAQHDTTLPLLDALGKATAARSPAAALLFGATQFLAWAKTEWVELADYGLNDRLRFLWHWGHARKLDRLI